VAGFEPFPAEGRVVTDAHRKTAPF